jgi:hypothetical protein
MGETPKTVLAALKKEGTSIAPFLRGLEDLFCVSPTKLFVIPNPL